MQAFKYSLYFTDFMFGYDYKHKTSEISQLVDNKAFYP
jgi:hypothetical protein